MSNYSMLVLFARTLVLGGLARDLVPVDRGFAAL